MTEQPAPPPVRSGDRVSHPGHPNPLLVLAVAGDSAQCIRPGHPTAPWLTLPVSELTPCPDAGG